MLAAQEQASSEVVRILLEKGKANINHRDKQGKTAIHWSAKFGILRTVQILVEHGAAVNYRTNEEYTPLHFAAEKGDREVCQYLISVGANIAAINKSGSTAASLARKHGHFQLLETLDGYGTSDINSMKEV